MSSNKRKSTNAKKNLNNNRLNHDQQFSINNLEKRDLRTQWDKLVQQTWDTVKNERKYKTMKLSDFKGVILTFFNFVTRV